MSNVTWRHHAIHGTGKEPSLSTNTENTEPFSGKEQRKEVAICSIEYSRNNLGSGEPMLGMSCDIVAATPQPPPKE